MGFLRAEGCGDQGRMGLKNGDFHGDVQSKMVIYS